MSTQPNKSEARKRYWAAKTQEERSQHARMMVLTRLNKMTKEQKSYQAVLAAKARWKKKLST